MCVCADHNSGNISLSDTFHNFHDYEIRWTPDKIEWLVDGQVGRSKERKDTWNETTQQWMFPQTPARVQLSIWPGGLASNAKGTVDWAGGEIDWNADDVKQAGYFYATFSEVSIECYQTTKAPGTNSGKSYTYDDAKGTNDTVIDGDKDTVLGSLEASGLDMDKGKQEKSSASSSAANASKTQNSIPGGGSAGQDHSGSGGSGGSGSSGGSGGGGGGGNSASSQPTAGGSGCAVNSFNQDCGSGSGSDNGGGNKGSGKSGSTKASASALAMIIAGVALYWL